MSIFDTAEAMGSLAIDYTCAPKSIKILFEPNGVPEYVVISRNDEKEAGEDMAMRLSKVHYEEYPFGNYTLFITYDHI